MIPAVETPAMEPTTAVEAAATAVAVLRIGFATRHDN
jgi:hypothetical protein